MTDIPNVAERKALLWYRVYGPSVEPQHDTPKLAMRMRLLQRGWIRMSEQRKRGDPMAFEISDKGREALDHEPAKPVARSHRQD